MKIFELLQGFVNLVGLFIIANTYKVKKDLAGKESNTISNKDSLICS